MRICFLPYFSDYENILRVRLPDDSYTEFAKVYENSNLTKVFESFFSQFHYLIFQIDDEFCIFYSQGQKKGNNWQEIAECRINEIKEEDKKC